MQNEALRTWVLLVAAHTKPSGIQYCDGSDEEWRTLSAQMLARREALALNPKRYFDCFLQPPDPTDASRPDHRRFVSTPNRQNTGPTNQWLHEGDAYQHIWPFFAGAMQGRTMYVVPYLLGPAGSKHARVGVQITDSLLVVAKLRILNRIGRVALQQLGASVDFLRGVHCRGHLEPERRYVVQFPELQTSWSFATENTEAAVMGHKWHALNLLGARAPHLGYLAEHMAILQVTTPAKRSHFIAAAFPSGCGKTCLATSAPTLPGYQVELVADGLCLLRVGEDGQLWAVNAAAGIDSGLGDARAADWMTPTRDSIYSNIAMRSDGSPRLSARAGARFTAPAAQCPHISRAFTDPDGVPISAILFGSRRSLLGPLVFEATSWEHGVYIGATLRSESTSLLPGPGVVRNDPMAMLPYCSYNMGDYLGHWLRLGQRLHPRPRIFHVNWFRTDASGKLLWPGFGENSRVLDWVIRRVERTTDARETPIGFVPRELNLEGSPLGREALEPLVQVDVGGWLLEALASWDFLSQFGDRLPVLLQREHDMLLLRLRTATN